MVEFIFGNRVELEQLPESAAESIGVQATRGGEFGSGLQNAGDNHGQYQIAVAAGLLFDEAVELQFVQGAEDGSHVAVRTRAYDIESLRQRSGEGSGALQDGAERIELSWGPVGKIGEGAVSNFAVDAEGFA